jgi:hypothetical protein
LHRKLCLVAISKQLHAANEFNSTLGGLAGQSIVVCGLGVLPFGINLVRTSFSGDLVMKKMQTLFAALVAAASVAVPATAQTIHVTGAGSSAQFLTAAIAADQLALGAKTGTQSAFHWTAKNTAQINDTRDSKGRITPEPGNVWVVWLADTSDATGNTNVTDIWLDISVDSTVGVRSILAQQVVGGVQASGDTVTITSSTKTADNLVSPATLWPDNNADVSLLAGNVFSTINNANSSTGARVNVGLTDIRAEDAFFATTRTLTALNETTYKGLGYNTSVAGIGIPIVSFYTSTAIATPINFALPGKIDPFTKKTVPAITTIPLGAAPIVFAYNNVGVFDPNVVDLTSGINGDGTKAPAGSYKLANLYDGTTTLNTGNAAFTGSAGSTAINVVLREPLSGTMNTTEFSLFRTTGNTNDSQETGVINPVRSPYNPLHLAGPGGVGFRNRAVGTGDVVNAIKGNNNTLGYFFYSFGNASKLTGSGFQYLTLDGVDPIGLTTTNQEFTNCPVSPATTCPASLWSGSLSYPHIRDGRYKAWSIYRWVVYTSELGADPLGPDKLAQAAQDAVDTSIADFVPFHTSSGSDGLEVYRSHFTQTLVANNGSATAANSLDGGNAMGGGTEQGGDMGGAIVGPNGVSKTSTGTVNTNGLTVTYVSGDHFPFLPKGIPANTQITINGVAYHVASNTSGQSLKLKTAAPVQSGVSYSLTITQHAAPWPTASGILNKKQ